MSNVCSLTKTYKHHAVKLRTTGNGVREERDNDGPSDSEEYCDFYIGADGPDENTSDGAKNIWGMWCHCEHLVTNFCVDQIIREFPFFPELHRIFVARPNVTPIAVTTGVGPHGKKTLHMQPIDGPQQDITGQIQTLQDALNHAQAQRTFGDVGGSQSPLEKENFFPDMQTPVSKKGPKPSSLSQECLSKAKEHIQKGSKKRTIEDTLFEIQKYIFTFLFFIFTNLIG